MSTETLRILCLDLEGGYGGSSRSLYESIRHIDRRQAAIEVWCRRDGPIMPRYVTLGVPCRAAPAMPRYSALPRLSRNVIALARFAREFARSGNFRADLVREVNARFDLIHFNHEALFSLAHWLRPRTKVPFTMHIRTNLLPTPFARWQVRAIADAADHLVFISPNEAETFRQHGGAPRAAAIIRNIVAPPDPLPVRHPDVVKDDRFKIACLSNYSWARGTDRLLDVADMLDRRGRRDILFIMAGQTNLTRSLPGLLGEIGRQGGTLADVAARRELDHMFLFLGKVSEPERVLVASDALAKPTRENNPWGRDILEAFAMGKPVLSCGHDRTFVETDMTGLLQAEFDAPLFADAIERLADDRALARRFGDAGRERVRTLCDGPARAAELLAIWQSVRRAA